ncbi:hypothetical protein K438DRAFT_1720696 [Mycena galopus ATCC 62051]|nr:hypothetical protein K438DRAFT_1720696 [Mycena galopus ATCC 62051]
MAVNHTSEAQLEGLVEVIEELYELLHDSGLATDADIREFWNLVTGFHSDHAEDQKRLFWLLKELKEKMEREVRGERVLNSMGYTEIFTLAFKCGQQAVEKAGGPAKWDAMSQVDQSRIYAEARAQLLRDIGQADFDALNEAEKADVDLFLWAGCAMHKDMNAFKGAAIGMEAFWEANGLQGPST